MIQTSLKSFEISPEQLKQSYNFLAQFLARKEIGFPDLPQRSDLWQSAKEQGSQLRKKFSDLVVVGIGGSALGPRVIVDLFAGASSSAHKVHFCDNVDPQEFDNLFHQLKDLDQVCWLIISKSGSTIETLTATDFVRQRYAKRGISFYDKVVVVSEKKSNPLTDWAMKNSIPQLEIPIDVGGRFSVLTPVGMLPAAFLGVDVDEFRRGAAWALQQKELIAEVMAQTISSYQRGEWISFFWFYSSGLKNFGGWLQQLWAESLGKKVNRKAMPAPKASTPFSAVGACDQHSVLQQVMEGQKDKFVVFTRVQSLADSSEVLEQSDFLIQKIMLGKKMGKLLDIEAESTQKALMQQAVSTFSLQIQDQSPATLGALFMFWQLVVAGLGEYLDINAFDQPGVELGKRLTKESLAAYN